MSTFKERVVKFAREQYNMGQTKFELFTEITPGTINKIKDGISTTTLAKIIIKCPELNVRWLLLGEGDMKIPEMSPTEMMMYKALSEFHTNNLDKTKDMDVCELQLLRQEKELRDKYDTVIAEKDEQIYKLTNMLEYAQKKDATNAECADVKHVG